jgi:hypothetical protein
VKELYSRQSRFGNSFQIRRNAFGGYVSADEVKPCLRMTDLWRRLKRFRIGLPERTVQPVERGRKRRLRMYMHNDQM